MAKGGLAPLLSIAALAFGQPELAGAAGGATEAGASFLGSGGLPGYYASVAGDDAALGAGALGAGAGGAAVANSGGGGGGGSGDFQGDLPIDPAAGTGPSGIPSPAETSDFGAGNTGFGNLAASAFSPSTAANPFSSMASTIKGLPWSSISGAMNIGSGIYGLTQRKRLEDMAKQAFGNYSNMGDPYASVKALMANPGSVTGQPGYQFGLDQGRTAIQRQGAASGGGGNEAIALARYTPEYAQNFYQNEVARQMGVAGGEANLGVASGGLGINAQTGSNALASSSLGSIGYGATQLGGGSPYDLLIKQMLSRMGTSGGATP